MTAAPPSSPAPDLFEAARCGDVAAVQALLDAGADVSAVNAYGFTALEAAACGANETPSAQNLAVLRLLIAAGSPIEHVGGGGRTALYLAAEFAQDVAPLKLLLEAGARADIRDEAGNHIVVNAMMPDVQALLSVLTGHPVPQPRQVRPPLKMRAADWRAAYATLCAVFALLEADGIVTAHDVGVTQGDGLADVAARFAARGGCAAGLIGMCFYTRQDLNRARRCSDLSLAFWGAPDGEPAAMTQVGRKIVEACVREGLSVDWNGSGSCRPTVDLRGAAG